MRKCNLPPNGYNMNAEKSSEAQARLMCRRCGRTFAKSQSLSQHCAMKHGLAVSEITCSICKVDLPSYQDYKTHTCCNHEQIVQSCSGTQAVCGLCNESRTAITMWTHIRVSHLYRSYYSTECKVCAQLIAVKDLKTHFAGKHPSIPCYRCTEVFGSIKAYNNHFSYLHKKIGQTATYPKQIRCGLCGELSRYSGDIIIHVFSVHLGRVPKNSTVCIYCCKVMPLDEYSAHLNSQHFSIQCLLCNESLKRTGYNGHLNSHMFS